MNAPRRHLARRVAIRRTNQGTDTAFDGSPAAAGLYDDAALIRLLYDVLGGLA